MKKARGFLLAEGALALLLVLLATGRLLQSLPGAALSLQRLVGRRELLRTRQDLHTRLEAALLTSVSQARVVQGKHGTELECYHRYSQAQWTFFVAESASTHLPTLYKGTWNQESRQKGGQSPDPAPCGGNRVCSGSPAGETDSLVPEPAAPADRSGNGTG